MNHSCPYPSHPSSLTIIHHHAHAGCGKTSLLDCLALRLRSFHGALKVNGKPVTSDYFSKVGYVYQEELLCGQLTPMEHLRFHAINSLSRYKSDDEIERLIEDVICEVKLGKW